MIIIDNQIIVHDYQSMSHISKVYIIQNQFERVVFSELFQN